MASNFNVASSCSERPWKRVKSQTQHPNLIGLSVVPPSLQVKEEVGEEVKEDVNTKMEKEDIMYDDVFVIPLLDDGFVIPLRLQ